jgi:hypothetical protein
MLLQVQEFEPWFKWLVMDAVLALLVGAIAERALHLRPVLRAIGWL